MVFGFRKRGISTIDFTKMPVVRLQQPSPANMKISGDCVDFTSQPINQMQMSQSSAGAFDFLNKMASSSSESSMSSSNLMSPSSNVVSQISEIAELKNKLRNFTNRFEELSNENYRLMQRIELLERKMERFGR